MLSRFWPIPVAILVLTGLLIWSQMIPTPLKVSGFIEADEIRLGSRVGGRVAEVKVAEGDVVEAGQPLIVLEPYDLLEKESEAAAQLRALEADLARLKAGNREEEIKQAKAKFDQLEARVKKLKAGARAEERLAAISQLGLAKSRMDRANETLKRLTNLAQRAGAVTDDELARAREEYEVATRLYEVRYQENETIKNGNRPEDIAEAEFMRDEARLAWELAQKGARMEDIRRAEAARDAAKSALDVISKQREELIIRAPSKAAVESLDLQKGDLVGAGAPVMSLIDHNSLWIRAYVPQGNLNISLKQKVAVTLDSFPDQRFDGEIVFIAQQGEFTPSNVQTPEERSKQVFRIKVKLIGKTDKLRPGMAADVWLDPPKDSMEGTRAKNAATSVLTPRSRVPLALPVPSVSEEIDSHEVEPTNVATRSPPSLKGSLKQGSAGVVRCGAARKSSRIVASTPPRSRFGLLFQQAQKLGHWQSQWHPAMHMGTEAQR